MAGESGTPGELGVAGVKPFLGGDSARVEPIEVGVAKPARPFGEPFDAGVCCRFCILKKFAEQGESSNGYNELPLIDVGVVPTDASARLRFQRSKYSAFAWAPGASMLSIERDTPSGEEVEDWSTHGSVTMLEPEGKSAIALQASAGFRGGDAL